MRQFRSLCTSMWKKVWRGYALSRQSRLLEKELTIIKQGHSQNDKPSRLQCGNKNREQGEAEHKADQGCQIARTEDE